MGRHCSNLIDADSYLSFVTQIILAFGIAFVIPLLLVALNMIGILSALTLAKAWRPAVFLTFLFAAIASPTPDAGSMLALAFPMVGLYLIAVGICWTNDRRRARHTPTTNWTNLPDDEASPLELLHDRPARSGGSVTPPDALPTRAGHDDLGPCESQNSV